MLTAAAAPPDVGAEAQPSGGGRGKGKGKGKVAAPCGAGGEATDGTLG